MSSWPETRFSIIRRLADRNDADAWAFFEDHYQQPVYRLARSHGLQPNDALDVVQEVLIAVHKAAANWRPSGRAGSFRAWLAESARRITLQIIRQRSRIGQGVGGSGFTYELGEAIDGRVEDAICEDAICEDAIGEDRWAFYCAAAMVEKEVNPQHWMAFWLTAVEGKSADVVASQLSMKSGTVYSAKCRVLAKLKSAIDSMKTTPNGEGDAK